MVMPYSHYQKALFKYNIGSMNLKKNQKKSVLWSYPGI